MGRLIGYKIGVQCREANFIFYNEASTNNPQFLLVSLVVPYQHVLQLRRKRSLLLRLLFKLVR